MTQPAELVLGDRYTLLDRIATGGMGEVWRATDALLGRHVAVKVLKEEFATDPSFLERFRNEARHTASLSHPGIANVFDYGEVDGRAFLVMELVNGEPLSTVLAREGRLRADRALDVVGQTALALQAAHDAGVVHRDVKPGNLILRPDGVVKVTDFGIARAVADAPVTQTGLLVGTAAYLSPEQANGRPATAASDIYSIGVVAYECFTGQRPFDGDSALTVASAHVHKLPPPLPADVPPLVADFVLRALEKDPGRRQSSAGDLGRTALALSAQLREPAPVATPTTTRVETVVEPASPRSQPAADDAQRRRVRNVFVAVGTAVVLLGFLLIRSCAADAPTVRVPAVVGQRYADAAAALDRRGLEAHRRDVPSTSTPAGVVLRQSAQRGSRLREGSIVTLTVSSGPRTVRIDAADVIGLPVADATRLLRSRNLLVAVNAVPADVAPGTVTGIDRTGTVREGSTVTLTVAAAVPDHPEPDKDKPPKHGHGD